MDKNVDNMQELKREIENLLMYAESDRMDAIMSYNYHLEDFYNGKIRAFEQVLEKISEVV